LHCFGCKNNKPCNYGVLIDRFKKEAGVNLAVYEPAGSSMKNLVRAMNEWAKENGLTALTLTKKFSGTDFAALPKAALKLTGEWFIYTKLPELFRNGHVSKDDCFSIIDYVLEMPTGIGKRPYLPLSLRSCRCKEI
jgi:hypothetical protein